MSTGREAHSMADDLPMEFEEEEVDDKREGDLAPETSGRGRGRGRGGKRGGQVQGGRGGGGRGRGRGRGQGEDREENPEETEKSQRPYSKGSAKAKGKAKARATGDQRICRTCEKPKDPACYIANNNDCDDCRPGLRNLRLVAENSGPEMLKWFNEYVSDPEEPGLAT